jgi:hypothetical protein
MEFFVLAWLRVADRATIRFALVPNPWVFCLITRVMIWLAYPVELSLEGCNLRTELLILCRELIELGSELLFTETIFPGVP